MAHAAVGGVFATSVPGGMCILDTEASVEHLVRGTTGGADALLAVVEPYPRSLLAGLRTMNLARDLGIEHVSLVVNKILGAEDEAMARDYGELHGLPLAALVPEDPLFIEADRTGAAPLDLAPDSPWIRSVAALADALTAGAPSPTAPR